MSLESIYRVVSHAHKSASEASGGTLEEKGAVAVLAGLSALLEARIQLHRQATPVPASAAPASAAPASAGPAAVAKPKLPAAAVAAQRSSAPPVPAVGKKPAGSDADDSYELK